MATVLVVDNNLGVLQIISKLLESEGYFPRTAMNGAEAVTIYRNERIDLVLLDRRMPGMDGEVTLAELRKHDPTMSCILMTASPGPDDRHFSVIGAYGQIDKPFANGELLKLIAEALKASAKP